MKKHFVIKSFATGSYFSVFEGNWSDWAMATVFATKEEALNFVEYKRLGSVIIEEVYQSII